MVQEAIEGRGHKLKRLLGPVPFENGNVFAVCEWSECMTLVVITANTKPESVLRAICFDFEGEVISGAIDAVMSISQGESGLLHAVGDDLFHGVIPILLRIFSIRLPPMLQLQFGAFPRLRSITTESNSLIDETGII